MVRHTDNLRDELLSYLDYGPFSRLKEAVWDHFEWLETFAVELKNSGVSDDLVKEVRKAAHDMTGAHFDELTAEQDWRRKMVLETIHSVFQKHGLDPQVSEKIISSVLQAVSKLVPCAFNEMDMEPAPVQKTEHYPSEDYVIQTSQIVRELRTISESLQAGGQTLSSDVCRDAADRLITLETAAVSVRPVEWIHRPAVSGQRYESWEANTLVGDYHVTNTRRGFEWHLSGKTGSNTAKNEENAKAAVFDDYSGRILAAIVISPRGE